MKIINITNQTDGFVLVEFEFDTEQEKKLLYAAGYKEAIKAFKKLIKTSGAETMKIPSENDIMSLGFNKVLRDYVNQLRDGAIGSSSAS